MDDLDLLEISTEELQAQPRNDAALAREQEETRAAFDAWEAMSPAERQAEREADARRRAAIQAVWAEQHARWIDRFYAIQLEHTARHPDQPMPSVEAIVQQIADEVHKPPSLVGLVLKEQMPAEPPEWAQQQLANLKVARKAFELDVAKEYHAQRARREAKRLLDREDAAGALRLPPTRDSYSLVSYAADDGPEPMPRIAGLQGAGHRALLQAQFKAGKSTLAADAAKALADGKPFLGTFDVEPVSGRVGIWNGEMADRDQLDYLTARNIEHPERIAVLNVRGYAVDLMTDDGRDWAIDWLKDNDVRYWILDPWSNVAGWSGLSINDNDEMGKLLQRIDQVAADAGVSELLIVHHIGWEGSHAKGASKLPEWADAIWTYKSDDGIRTFSATGRGVDVKPGVVQLTDTGELTFGDTTRGAVKLDQTISEAVKFVTDHPHTSRTPLYAALPGNNQTKKAAVDAAIERDLIINETADKQTASLIVNPHPPQEVDI